MRVILETPYAGVTDEEVRANELFARACMLDSLLRGEAPYLSHLLYTQVLDDRDPEQRELGIRAGFAWRRGAEKTVVYVDRGISNGMWLGILDALRLGHRVEYRQLNQGGQ